MWHCTAFRLSIFISSRCGYDSLPMRDALICAIFRVLFILARQAWNVSQQFQQTLVNASASRHLSIGFTYSGGCSQWTMEQRLIWGENTTTTTTIKLAFRMINYAFNFRQLLLRMRVWFKSVWFGSVVLFVGDVCGTEHIHSCFQVNHLVFIFMKLCLRHYPITSI